MKRISILGNIFIAILAIFALSSCDPTESGSGPIVELQSGGITATSIDTLPGALLTFNLVGTSGDVDMKTVKFYEDGVAMTDYATRISIDGTSAWANPILLTGAEAQSFDWIVTILSQDGESTNSFKMEVLDVDGKSNAVNVSVTTATSAFPGPFGLTMLAASGDCIDSDQTYDPEDWFCVSLEGVRSTENALYRLSIIENNVGMTDLARVGYNGVTVSELPIILTGADLDGFVSEISIQVQNTEGTTNSYGFILEDLGSNMNSASVINITTTTTSTSLTNSLTAKLLYNAGGPAGKGALDLDFGFGTGITTNGTDATPTDAEIRDMGIDGDGNWLKQIAPMNDGLLRRVNLSGDLATTFDAVTAIEEVQEAYNHANSTSVTTSAPAAVIVGDQFVLERGGVHYLIECTFLNDEAGNSNDYYEFKIKY